MSELFSGQLIFLGVDMSTKDGDMSCEVEVERLSDGTVAVRNMRSWKHDIELKANRPEALK